MEFKYESFEAAMLIEMHCSIAECSLRREWKRYSGSGAAATPQCSEKRE